MQKIKPIVRNWKKYRNSLFFKAKFLYTKYYETLPLKENVVLFESFQGVNFTGAPYYIFMEMYHKEEYQSFQKIVAVSSSYLQTAEDFFHARGMDDVRVVVRNSKEYCNFLATAKYLVNNVTFPAYFMRREGQVYLNTWHGTPLKALGRSIQNHPADIGNVQRNFVHATHLLFSNEYMFEHMKEDYMLDDLYHGEYILGGSPVNTIFYHPNEADKLRETLGLQNKKIIVYMPTWRDKEANKKHDKQIFYIMHMLYTMDRMLSEDTVVLVKLHHMGMSNICFSDFEKIQAFPEDYETYEVLNMADALITDYSSVMFDFLNKDKPVFLYVYDKEEYMHGRSMYFDLDTLPFEQFEQIFELCNKLNQLSCIQNTEKVKKTFCSYDGPNAISDICKYIFLNRKNSRLKIISAKKYDSNKKKILIFGGTLKKNGITTALNSLLCNIDTKQYHYFLTFFTKAGEENPQFVYNLNRDISYISLKGTKNLRFKEAIAQYLYFRFNWNFGWIMKQLKKIFYRESYRLFANNSFDVALHFSGYERKIIHLLRACSKKSVIVTHSNLLEESKLKSNVHTPSIRYAYQYYDVIATVRDGMRDEIIKHVKWVDCNKFHLLHNLNDIEGIQNKAKQEVIFDTDTESNVSLMELRKILKSDAMKFINIARFSVEKQLDLLIKAFMKYQQKYPNSYLILIGGYGPLYQEILDLANQTEHVIVIKSMNNPMSVLNRCDLFILSSLYEGLPMTIMEALILKKPVLSTDIPSVRQFFANKYGMLVENNLNGLYQGMVDFTEGNMMKPEVFDASTFNQQALQEFYDIIEK